MKLKFIPAFLAMIGATMRLQASNYGHAVPTPSRRHRYKQPSTTHGQPGAKLLRKAMTGTLTKRHPSSVDSHFAELYAKRITQKNAARRYNGMKRKQPVLFIDGQRVGTVAHVAIAQ